MSGCNIAYRTSIRRELLEHVLDLLGKNLLYSVKQSD